MQGHERGLVSRSLAPSREGCSPAARASRGPLSSRQRKGFPTCFCKTGPRESRAGGRVSTGPSLHIRSMCGSWSICLWTHFSPSRHSSRSSSSPTPPSFQRWRGRGSLRPKAWRARRPSPLRARPRRRHSTGCRPKGRTYGAPYSRGSAGRGSSSCGPSRRASSTWRGTDSLSREAKSARSPAAPPVGTPSLAPSSCSSSDRGRAKPSPRRGAR
mmetsp:Transcript_63504/g.143230  ORF Transcript_63504/g.143230 Transcript_63504/m.143230 type:complete len:214 (+) Transcript_63504:315-956(+)